jgi:hypothetical protein
MRAAILRLTRPCFNSSLQAQVRTSSDSRLTHPQLYTTRPRRFFTSSFPLQSRTGNMDTQELSHTQSVAELTATLANIGISEVPQEPNTYPTLNPVDLYRSHITELLAPVAGVDRKIVYNSLQWPNTLDKGDLVLAVPALRLKGKKPPELALELSQKVSMSCDTCRCTLMTILVPRITPHRKAHRGRQLYQILFQATGTPPNHPAFNHEEWPLVWL